MSHPIATNANAILIPIMHPSFVKIPPVAQGPWTPCKHNRCKSHTRLVQRPGRNPTAKLSSNTPRNNLPKEDKSEITWYRSLQSLPSSSVLLNVWPQVVAAFAWSSAVVIAHSVLKASLGPGYDSPPLSTTPHAFLSTALSLVLVFRTNAAYDRFWEGRKIWGSVVNTTRNTARLVAISLDVESSRMAARLLVCFAHTLAQRLQNTESPEPSASLLTPLSRSMSDRIEYAPNKPMECLLALGEIVRYGSYNDCEVRNVARGSIQTDVAGGVLGAPCSRSSFPVKGDGCGCDQSHHKARDPNYSERRFPVPRLVLETCIGELFGQLGACERISGTRVPLTYSRHATRLLALFLMTLPIVLVDQPGGSYFTIPAVVFVTWAFSGIDEVAHLIEDPFLGTPASLQLEPICEKIQRDILEQIVPHVAPEEAESVADPGPAGAAANDRTPLLS